MWKFFEGFYVLTGGNEERKQRILKNLGQVGISPVFFSPPQAAKKNNASEKSTWWQNFTLTMECDETCQNIAQNHIKMIQNAYDLGNQAALFFEDDAEFILPLPKKKIENAIKWLSSNMKEWDIFYFGYCQYPIPFSIFKTKDIVSVTRPLGFHCYALNRSGMEKIMSMGTNDHIDLAVSRNPDIKKLALFPSISFQSVDPAIFREMYLPVGFSSVSVCMEFVSVLMPLFLLLVALYVIWWFYQRKKS